MARRLVLAVVLLVAGDARAEDEMSAFKANVEAAGWLLPTLTLHTVLHEGSHALAARSIGAQAVQIHWLPGNWALGVTGWMKRGRSEREVAFVAVAPAITNLVVLSAITILSERSASPRTSMPGCR